jgi:hypothetical protein
MPDDSRLGKALGTSRRHVMSFNQICRRFGTVVREARVLRGRHPRTRNRKPCLESLESRQLLAVTASLSASNVLQVMGTGNIAIQVQQLNYDQIQVVQTQGTKGTLIPISQAGATGTVNSVSVERLTGITVIPGGGTNTVYVGVHVKGAAVYPFNGLVQVQGGPGVDTLENDLYRNCILRGGGAPAQGHDNFADTTTYKTTRFVEPFSAEQPALPGPGAPYTDIVQGSSDNCYFLAPLSSLALTNPNLASRITYKGGNTYSVAMFAKGANDLPYVRQISVTFDGSWTVADPYEPQAGEFWTILFSRAFNQLKASENLPATGNEAWFALTGRNPDGPLSNGSLNSGDAKRIYQAILGGGNATVVTPTSGVSSALIANHFYTVVADAPAGSSDYLLTLRNPWGRSPNANGGQFQILWSQLRGSLAAYLLNTPLYISDSQGGLYTVDLFNGAAQFVGQTKFDGQNEVMFDLAFSPTGQLYGLGSDGDLYTIDRHTAVTTQVGPITDQATNRPITSDANAMAFRTNGVLYVAAQGSLYTVDPETAKATQVSTLPNNERSAGDLVFDPSGNLYLTTADGTLLKMAAGTTTLTVVGSARSLGVPDIYGLVWFDNALYGFSNTGGGVYVINTGTGVASQITTPYSRLLIPNPNGGASGNGPNGTYGAAMLPA